MGILEHQRKMPWMDDDEVLELAKVDEIHEAIVKHKGILPPVANTSALNWMAHYYSNVCERVGKNKAMRDELMARLLTDDEKLSVAKADVLARGSEFGIKAKYYENVAAGYIELINGFKKTQDFHSQSAKNQV